MKKYEQPAIELIEFSLMDVLTASTQNFDTPVEQSESGSFDEMFGL